MIKLTRNEKQIILIPLLIILIGLLAVGASYITFINPPQCPGNFTQEQIDNSQCIVGANIGAGLVWLLGIGMTIIGSLAFVGSIIYSVFDRKSRKINVSQSVK